MASQPTFDACEFQAPSSGARVNLFRAEAATFASEGDGRPQILLGVLLRGMVRTETASGLLVSDARESPRIWIMPADTCFAITAIPGHPPAILGAALDPDVLAHYLEEATRTPLALPDVPQVLEDPVAALGLEAFHRSLWSGTGPSSGRAGSRPACVDSSMEARAPAAPRPWPSRAAWRSRASTSTPTTARRYR